MSPLQKWANSWWNEPQRCAVIETSKAPVQASSGARCLSLAYPARFSAIFTRSGYCRLIRGGFKTTSWMMPGRRFWRHFWRISRQTICRQLLRYIRSRTEHRLLENVVIFLREIDKITNIQAYKCNCRKKSMQEKESIMVVRYEFKIPSLGITVRHHSASLVMPNSYPRDEIFNPYLTTIKDSYILCLQLSQVPYIVWVSNEGFGDTARMTKYIFHMSWLKFENISIRGEKTWR